MDTVDLMRWGNGGVGGVRSLLFKVLHNLMDAH